MTGTTGEVEFTSNMAQLQADLMNATGQLEARAIDCTYSRADYVDWKPSLVIAHHIHRDGAHRAMFAIPDNAFGFHSDAASRESMRLLQRVLGGYTRTTGIPIDQDSITLRMRQLYTWCYLDADSQAIIPEYGNGNLDTETLFNADRVRILAKFMVDCTLEHFDLAGIVPTPVPAPKTEVKAAAAALRVIADKLDKVA
jgi:hypothetical protein